MVNRVTEWCDVIYDLDQCLFSLYLKHTKKSPEIYLNLMKAKFKNIRQINKFSPCIDIRSTTNYKTYVLISIKIFRSFICRYFLLLFILGEYEHRLGESIHNSKTNYLKRMISYICTCKQEKCRRYLILYLFLKTIDWSEFLLVSFKCKLD